jgi:Zn-dependent protease/predicted transcriptional regulator
MTQETGARRPFLPGTHRGIPLFSVLGIRVIADYSWFLIVALIAGTLALVSFPEALPGRSTIQYVALGLITAFFVFASVVIHELAHSIVAVLNGIPVRRITLFLFGGVAEITKEPPDPGTELKVALAGPAASAALAAAFWATVLLMGPYPARPGLRLAFIHLATANTILLAFNLLPGLPLDGGRVLRAILWRVSRNLKRATYIASTLGKVLAGLLVLLGIVAILSETYVVSGLWFIFIALFLRHAADWSYRQVVLREALAGIRVGDVMARDVVTVSPEISLAELIDCVLLRYHFTCYPVVSDGRPVGVITIKLVKQVPRDAWGATRVAEAMLPIGEGVSLTPDDDVLAALQKMGQSGLSRLPVLSGQELVGIVSRRDITAHIRIRADLFPRQTPPP